MSSSLKLPYGLRGEQLLHVADVANGLVCACVRAGCGARNQDKLKVPHFAHYQAPECASGLQTALHLAATSVADVAGQVAAGHPGPGKPPYC